MLVLDAGVVVKWLLADPEHEEETALATELMRQVADGRQRVIQPVHWLLEVGAVLARLSPVTAEQDLALLQAMELATDDAPNVLVRACGMAIELNQHLFDTLYHAVALEQPEATLVTADKRYLAAGRPLGRVVSLAEYEPAL